MDQIVGTDASRPQQSVTVRAAYLTVGNETKYATMHTGTHCQGRKDPNDPRRNAPVRSHRRIAARPPAYGYQHIAGNTDDRIR